MIPDDASANLRAGHADGYRVGPDGIDPDGKPVTTGYQDALFVDPDYRAGLSLGRADRIDEQLADGTHQIYAGWPT